MHDPIQSGALPKTLRRQQLTGNLKFSRMASKKHINIPPIPPTLKFIIP
jgi:hypothetical protein